MRTNYFDIHANRYVAHDGSSRVHTLLYSMDHYLLIGLVEAAAAFIRTRHEVAVLRPGKSRRDDYEDVHQTQAQLALLRSFVEYSNVNPHEWLVSCERRTMRMVYVAMATYHQYKVFLIEESIREQGTHFGSATLFHTECIKSLVEGWPQRYKFDADLGFTLQELPCRRPDWPQRVAEYTSNTSTKNGK